MQTKVMVSIIAGLVVGVLAVHTSYLHQMIPSLLALMTGSLLALQKNKDVWWFILSSFVSYLFITIPMFIYIEGDQGMNVMGPLVGVMILAPAIIGYTVVSISRQAWRRYHGKSA